MVYKGGKMKTAHHDNKFKQNLTTRLKKAEGQVRGIIKMIENDTYCDDVLNQITAVESALNSVRRLLLEAHIKSCVVQQIKEDKLEVIDELMLTIKKIIR